ncbi:uncharacterized protein MELLADRAFT_108306 [Melampsora larici-populina 98AG31]|uniref:Uncharacterized protein n=1 Tax=Melampsora larici-populina (strain 98AG31 / pathotype 3-4-7) TaxID=747676 RepID=F4RSN5_MELLP|nr:uncharacterized protein MELLADRAFT_108306 [Melampsora larici-populina 98AG31]EGG04660.1 hypothetical protein MELLADRAFT_108306 [Melampsora larici-populina 98AG31]
MSFEIPTSIDAAAREIFLEDYDEEVLDYESGKLRAANRSKKDSTMPAFGLRDRIIIHTEPSRNPSNQTLHHQHRNCHHSPPQNQLNSSFQNLSVFGTTTRSNLRSFTDSLCIRPTVSQISQGIKDIMSKKPKYIRRKVVEDEDEKETCEVEFIADERRRRRQGTILDGQEVDQRLKAEFGFDMSRISESSSLDVSNGCD